VQVYRNEGFARPKPRRSTETVNQRRGWFSLTSLFLIQNDQERSPRDTATRLYTYALVFSWVVAVLRIIVTVLLWLLSFFLLKSLIVEDAIPKFTKAIRMCREVWGRYSCLRIFSEIFFPISEQDEQPWLILEITERGCRPDAYLLHDTKLPLYYASFAFMVLAGITLIIVQWLLGRIHSLLVDTMAMAKVAAGDQQNLPPP
jgi:hypothetical protein